MATAPLTDRPTDPVGSGLRVFRSRRHPGTDALPLAYARALSGPFAFGMTALMVLGTVSVLSGLDPLPWLVWAAPVTALLASAFALYQMRRTVVEIGVGVDRAIARTVWDVLVRHVPLARRVTAPRTLGDETTVGLGRDILTLDGAEWPEFKALLDALQVAAEHGRIREPG